MICQEFEEVLCPKNRIIAAAASEPEANERGSSLISRRLHYRGLQSLFSYQTQGIVVMRKWGIKDAQWYAQGIMVMRERKHFRMRSDMAQGTVVMLQ